MDIYIYHGRENLNEYLEFVVISTDTRNQVVHLSDNHLIRFMQFNSKKYYYLHNNSKYYEDILLNLRDSIKE